MKGGWIHGRHRDDRAIRGTRRRRPRPRALRRRADRLGPGARPAGARRPRRAASTSTASPPPPRPSRPCSTRRRSTSLVPGPYALEVSSPGLERPLRTPAHFGAAVGETVSVKTRAGDDRPRPARARRGRRRRRRPASTSPSTTAAPSTSPTTTSRRRARCSSGARSPSGDEPRRPATPGKPAP